MAKPRINIYVAGGVVQGIDADVEIDVVRFEAEEDSSDEWVDVFEYSIKPDVASLEKWRDRADQGDWGRD